MINNMNYGMTGGQVSPATPHGNVTKTSPYGNVEHPFDPPSLAIGAGATFVARETAAHPRRIISTLEKAIRHQGFSFIDIICQCPTHAGRNFFGDGDPVVIFKEIKKRAVQKKDQALEPGQFRVGILHEDASRAPFTPVRVHSD